MHLCWQHGRLFTRTIARGGKKKPLDGSRSHLLMLAELHPYLTAETLLRVLPGFPLRSSIFQ